MPQICFTYFEKGKIHRVFHIVLPPLLFLYIIQKSYLKVLPHSLALGMLTRGCRDLHRGTLQIFTDDLQKTICKIVFHVVFAHYILRFCIFHWKYRKIYAVIIYYCGWILNIDLIYVIHIEINYSAFTKGEILEKPVIRFLNFFLFPASMTF